MTDEDGEVRALTEAAVARFRRAQEVDPGTLQTVADVRRLGRRPVASPKVRIGLRLAQDVVQGIRAGGPGDNARVEKVLREALAKGEL